MIRAQHVLFLLSISATPAFAATYYVAPTGNDSQDPTVDSTAGTIGKPFRTLNYAVRFLKPGETLFIRAGTYAEALIDNIPAGTSWSAPVTVSAYQNEPVTLRPPAGATWVLHFYERQSYIVVNGLVLD